MAITFSASVRRRRAGRPLATANLQKLSRLPRGDAKDAARTPRTWPRRSSGRCNLRLARRRRTCNEGRALVARGRSRCLGGELVALCAPHDPSGARIAPEQLKERSGAVLLQQLGNLVGLPAVLAQRVRLEQRADLVQRV